MKELKQKVSSAGEVTLLAGFPPQPIVADDNDLVASVIPMGTRVIVRITAASSGGGGRRKPAHVRRLQEGVAPRDSEEPTPAEAGPAAAGGSSGPASAGSGPSAIQPSAPKRKRAVASVKGTEVAAERSGDASDDPATGDQADPLARTLKAARGSGGGGGKPATGSSRDTKAKSIEKITSEFFSGSGSAIDAAARGGGKVGTSPHPSSSSYAVLLEDWLCLCAFRLLPIPAPNLGSPIFASHHSPPWPFSTHPVPSQPTHLLPPIPPHPISPSRPIHPIPSRSIPSHFTPPELHYTQLHPIALHPHPATTTPPLPLRYLHRQRTF